MLNEIPTPEAFRKEKLRVTPLEFEKDDDSNGHIDFIVGTFYLQCCIRSTFIRTWIRLFTLMRARIQILPFNKFSHGLWN
jgi:hypothetical protein